MRARRLLLLGSIITPTGAVVSGCFNSASPPGGNPDAAFGQDVFLPGDDGPAMDTSMLPQDSSMPEVSAEAGAPPGTNLTTATFDFGSADCGSTPPTKTLTFQNTGGTPLTYSASLAKGTAFSIQGPKSGSVAPGQSGSIVLAPAAITGAAVAGTPLTDMLDLTTNVPGAISIAVPLKITPEGGSITVSPAASFGQEFLNVAAPDIALQVKNVGTKAVSVAIATPTHKDFGVGWTGAPAAVALAPNASLAGAVAHFTPTSAGLQTENVAIQVTGPLCAPASPAVAFSGTGTTGPIAIGPGAVDFLSTPCGSTGPLEMVTLTNSSSTAVTYNAVLQLGASSPYTLTGGSGSGSVPANGTATINIQPNLVAPAPGSLVAGALDDTLAVTTGTGGGGAAANIALTQAANGVVLAVSMPTTAFGSVVVGTPGSLPFSVTNTGNIAANVTALASGAPGYSAALAASIPADGAAHAGSVTLAAQPPYGSANATLAVTTSSPLCQASQPAAIPMTATTQGPIATFSSSPLLFAPRCGQSAPAPVALNITNNGTSPLTITSAMITLGAYSVMSIPGPIAPGNSGSIMVVANAASGEAGGSVRAGTLSFSTNEYGAPSYPVPLSATIMGANLAFTDSGGKTITSQPLVCCSSASPCNVWWYCPYTGLTYNITNTGNEAAKLGVPVVSEPLYFSVNPLTPSSTIGPGASSSSSPNGPDYTAMPPMCSPSGPLDHNETVQYPATGDICVPLPILTILLEGNTPC